MILSRECPKCGRDIFYSCSISIRRAKINNSICPACRGLLHKGKIVSEETRLKMKDNHSNVSGENNPNYGKVSAMRGKRIEDFMSAENVVLHKARLNVGLFTGGKHINKEKFSKKGTDNGFFGRKHSVKTIDKIRSKTIVQIQQGRTGKSDSSIELKFENYLNELNIKYEKQKQAGFHLFDFYLSDFDIYIECDGDYWHVNPDFFGHPLTKAQVRNLINDRRKNTYLSNRGKVLLRFWENEINNNKDFVISKIKDTIKCAS